MKYFLINSLLIIISNISPVFSTIQKKEKLIFNNDTCFILETPLCSIDVSTLLANISTESSNCWRGYTGIWEIKDSTLYLNKMLTCDEKDSFDIKKYFKKDNRIKAEWYSGNITIIGTTEYYTYRPFDTYSPQIRINIKNGKVLNLNKINDKNIERILKRKRIIKYSILYGCMIVPIIFILNYANNR